jgi:hypothetical protein
MQNPNVNTSSFEGLVDNYIKAEDIKEFPAKVFVTFCNIENRDGKNKVIYDVQYDGKKYKWSCNVTNLRVLQKLGLQGPKDLCNKNVIFTSVRVRNPSTGQNMDSLSVDGLE